MDSAITKKINKNLICELCKGLVFDPKKCEFCEQFYCNDEITLYKETYQKCPNCNKKNPNFLSMTTRLERNIYNETEVDGCTLPTCEKKGIKSTLE